MCRAPRNLHGAAAPFLPSTHSGHALNRLIPEERPEVLVDPSLGIDVRALAIRPVVVKHFVRGLVEGDAADLGINGDPDIVYLFAMRSRRSTTRRAAASARRRFRQGLRRRRRRCARGSGAQRQAMDTRAARFHERLQHRRVQSVRVGVGAKIRKRVSFEDYAAGRIACTRHTPPRSERIACACDTRGVGNSCSVLEV